MNGLELLISMAAMIALSQLLFSVFSMFHGEMRCSAHHIPPCCIQFHTASETLLVICPLLDTKLTATL